MNLKTNHPIAFDSPDHVQPWGTANMPRTNPRFLVKLMNLYPAGYFPSILDLGCGSGAFVREAVDFGCDAYGLEGSDYSLRNRRSAWRDIPERLFTCDITKVFSTEAWSFDVITLWETVEHLDAHGLQGLMENVRAHLKLGGLIIVSTASGSDKINGVELHQTQWPKSEWVAFFKHYGLTHHETLVRYFNSQFVRGPKFGSEESFHLCLTQTVQSLPTIPKEHWGLRLYDRWLGSLPQRFLAGTFIKR